MVVRAGVPLYPSAYSSGVFGCQKLFIDNTMSVEKTVPIWYLGKMLLSHVEGASVFRQLCGPMPIEPPHAYVPGSKSL